MKNNVYPHTFRFFMRENRKAQMQYKNWATDATWLPHRKPLAILWSIPEGIPSLAQPILRCKEGIQRDELLGKTKRGSNRMRDAQLKWWGILSRNRSRFGHCGTVRLLGNMKSLKANTGRLTHSGSTVKGKHQPVQVLLDQLDKTTSCKDH